MNVTAEQPPLSSEDGVALLLALGRGTPSPDKLTITSTSGSREMQHPLTGVGEQTRTAIPSTNTTTSVAGGELTPIKVKSANMQVVASCNVIDKSAIISKKKVRKTTRRDTTISYDEMTRLMGVYGSVKCLRVRNRKNDPTKAAKIDSIKRKFYRWFPDLDERFERTPEGMYEPKAGHEEELKYREMMRKQDQDKLVKKRLTTRVGPSSAI